tara:strand:- start:3953 stop:4984 length:1032 start_codon:yes stop_codon:yes gene_type:complete
MGALVNNFSRHDCGFEEYIARNHPDPQRYREYRYRWDNNKKDLLYLLIETLWNCNLTCPMCIHSVGYDEVKKMDDGLFNLVLNNIRDLKIPSICMNNTNEPLLDKKIISRIKQVAEIDCVLDIHMNSNGVLLDENMSRKIIDSGLTKLLIGFDGFSKATYEKIRTGGADFDKVLGNILRFLEIRDQMKSVFPVVRVSFVRTSDNEMEIDDWIKFWENKADYITVQEYLTQHPDDSKNYLRPKGNKRKLVAVESITCPSPFERVVVRGDGAIFPCCSPLSLDMPMGNLHENSLAEIWNGKTFEDLREYFIEGKWQEHDICGKCLKTSYEIGDSAEERNSVSIGE